MGAQLVKPASHFQCSHNGRHFARRYGDRLVYVDRGEADDSSFMSLDTPRVLWRADEMRRTMHGMGGSSTVGSHPDAKLWRECQRGSSQAFDDLYIAHYQPVFLYCLRRTAKFQDAEDVTSRTFEELWKQRSRVICDPVKGLRPWLYTVARRSCSRNTDDVLLLPEIDPHASVSAVNLVEEQALNRHLSDMLLQAMKELPIRDQQIARLSFVDEMTSAQIAQRLDVPSSTVRSCLGRIRTRLEATVQLASPTLGGESDA